MIHRDWQAGQLYLSQKKYIEKVLEHFGIDRSILVSTPLATHFKLSTPLSPQTKVEHISRVPHASAVSSLTYTMICTRPIFHILLV